MKKVGPFGWIVVLMSAIGLLFGTANTAGATGPETVPVAATVPQVAPAAPQPDAWTASDVSYPSKCSGTVIGKRKLKKYAQVTVKYSPKNGGMTCATNKHLGKYKGIAKKAKRHMTVFRRNYFKFRAHTSEPGSEIRKKLSEIIIRPYSIKKSKTAHKNNIT